MLRYKKPAKNLAAIFVMTLFYAWPAFAIDPTTSIQVIRNEKRNSFFGGAEIASLQSRNQSLIGYGAQVGYRYVLSPQWAFDASLSQIFSRSARMSALYTGIAASARYALTNQFDNPQSSILFDGKRIVTETTTIENVWSLGLQTNQLFLNGETFIYNATGLGVSLTYDFKAFGIPLRPELRYSVMAAGGSDLKALFINILIPF